MEKYSHLIEKITNSLLSEDGELEKESYKWILNACRTARAASIEVRDYGYDKSSHGRLEPGLIDTSEFETIQDFFDYPTGQSIPTYSSGSGMCAETWGDSFCDFAKSYIWDWIRVSEFFPQILDTNEVIDDVIDDEFYDAVCVTEIDEYNFSVRFGKKPFPRLRLVV